MRFDRYAKQAKDGPVLVRSSSVQTKPDHGVKPHYETHVAKPRPANAEEFKFENPKGESK